MLKTFLIIFKTGEQLAKTAYSYTDLLTDKELDQRQITQITDVTDSLQVKE